MKKIAGLLMAFAAACALSPLANADVHYYLVDSVATKSTDADLRAEAHELEKIYADMERQSGVDAKLVWSTNPDINAFATEVGGEKIVVVQEGLLSMMNGDRDAVAAVLGHELGHHKADHIRAGRRKEEGARALGTILGAVVGAKLGKGSGAVAGAAVGGVGGNLVALKFNRDQEMEADRLSIGWMISAGYNPQGMLRLQQRLGELDTHSHAAILSTHPTSEKRYKAAQQLIAKLSPSQDILSLPVQPLVGDGALASATAEIKGIENDRIAEALGPSEQPNAASLAPVQKISFDTYAAIANQLEFAGPKGKAHVFATNHVTEKQYQLASDAFDARMKNDPALVRQYSVAYFRASQGKFAAYGRDLADSYEKSQALRLEPPFPIATAAQLNSEMTRRGAIDDEARQAKAENDVLKPRGFTYYDYTIGSLWWTRKASIAALTGDTSLMRQYLAQETADDDDDDAPKTVATGPGVHVYSNVRISGRTVTPEAPPKTDQAKP